MWVPLKIYSKVGFSHNGLELYAVYVFALHIVIKETVEK